MFDNQIGTFAESFSVNTTNQGKRQVHLLKLYLGRINSIYSLGKYYAPFVPLVQSSGYGKTKVCFEMLRECPGIPLIFRKPTQRGYPFSSAWVENFYVYALQGRAKDDLPRMSKFPREHAVLYTPSRFLIALNILLDAYFRWFDRIKRENNNDLTRTLDILGEHFVQNPSIWGDEENPDILFEYSGNITIEGIINEIKRKMALFLRGNGMTLDLVEPPLKRVHLKLPFIFVLDELNDVNSLVKPGRTSAVNVVRRGLHVLAVNSSIVALALGTNTDVISFMPTVRDNSLRILARSCLLPPLIISRNFDIFLDTAMWPTIELSHADLLNPKLMNLLIAMGRPLWSSIPLFGIVSWAEVKIRNGSFASGEHFLACWLIRCSLNINHSHVVAQTLVNSHMATVYHVSSDGTSMKIKYPSEPSLALGARAILSDPSQKLSTRHEAFKILLNFIEQRAVDKGRFTEVIFEQIVLYAIDDSSTVVLAEPSEIVHNEAIRRICNASDFILEVQKEAGDPEQQQPQPADVGEDQFKYYHVVQIRTFLVSFFGGRVLRFLRVIPQNILMSLANSSHFVTISRDRKNVMESRFKLLRANTFTSGCDIIDRALLKLGLMRQCGFVMPANYFGFDFGLPYVKENIAGRRPIYSFIPFQVKAGDTSIHDAVVKMALQFHLCKCLAHATGVECSAETCPARTSDSEFDIICRDQLAILLCGNMSLDLRTGDDEAFFYIKSNNAREFAKGVRTTHELFERNVRAIRKPFPSFSGSRSLKRANMTPDVILFKSLSPTLAVEIMRWGDYTLTCLISSQLDNFKHLIGARSINVARRIIDYDSVVFDDIDPIHLPSAMDAVFNSSFADFPDVDKQATFARGHIPTLNPPGFALSHFTDVALQRSIKRSAERNPNQN